MTTEFENIIQRKIANAPEKAVSEARKKQLWANISTDVAKNAQIAANATNTATSISKVSILSSAKYFVIAHYKMAILSVVCSLLAVGAFTYLNDNTAPNDAKNEVVNSTANSSIAKEILTPTNANTVEAATQNNFVNANYNSVSNLNNQAASQTTATQPKNELSLKNAVTNTDAQSNTENSSEFEKPDNTTDAAIALAATETNTDENTTTDSLTKTTEPVVVKKTVVVDNKEVKIIKKKSKYSR